MSRPVPSPGGERLAAALRESRRRTGLSLAGLADRTAYSKSSWERYLNGRTLPPRSAVRELCRLAGEPDGRCLALWEIAKSESGGQPREAARPRPPAPTQGPTAAVPPPEAGTEAEAAPTSAVPVQAAEKPAPAGHRGAAVAAVLASVCAVVFGAVALTLLLLPDDGPAPRPVAAPSGAGPYCRGAACEGRNAMAMKCAAAPETLAEHVTATGASVQLRHSAVCGTSWARMWGARIGDRIEFTAAGGAGGSRGARVENQADADGYVSTLMTVTRPGTAVRACFLPTPGGDGRECFEARVGQGPTATAPAPRTGSATAR
ncbi:helix-turn-helix domain-containing protein [Streptomyces sp. NPDC003401]